MNHNPRAVDPEEIAWQTDTTEIEVRRVLIKAQHVGIDVPPLNR